MPQQDWLALIVIGALFIAIGLGAVLWGRSEEKGYYDSLTGRPDSREFLEHWPQRPQFGSLKIGGWIALIIGIAMLITGFVFWLR